MLMAGKRAYRSPGGPPWDQADAGMDGRSGGFPPEWTCRTRSVAPGFALGVLT
jgi:hypothetical protein